MGDWKREKLRVSVDGRYLQEGDEPFFWLGDTAWMMLQKLSEEEIRLYLENRRAKGFNVIQTVLVHSLPEKGIGDQMGSKVKNPITREYFDFCRRMAEMAEEMGIYMGLLPCWGSVIKNGVINLSNVDRYAEYLGETFRRLHNVIWILGGDIRGDQVCEVVRKEAEILKRYNPERLMTFHPFGRTSSSLWFREESWLDFNMFQSGHRRYDQQFLGEWDDNKAREEFFGEDNWRYVDRDLGYGVPKPTLDGEPSYEGIPQGLHNPREPYWQDNDVRRYAYWSVLAGACGHTYGHNSIMQFYETSEGAGAYGVREPWQEAIHAPGAAQLVFLKELMSQVDWQHGSPMEHILVYGQKERYHRIAIFGSEDYVICYTYSGDEFCLDLSGFSREFMTVCWMDPENGIFSPGGVVETGGKAVFRPLRKEHGGNDWVLLLRKTCKDN